MGESVRIVVLDYYMSPPIPGLDVTYSEFRASSINQVPIIRCFGSTQKGEKICVHIHGVFPYLYIPYDGSGNAEDLMHKIAASIDRAVNISLNQGSSFTQHVYKIALVSGIPMYGFHPKKHQFFKIFLYNPMLISKVATLLLNHSILDQVFQPHETHLNFTLQFMIDYNLHGMSDMNIYELKYRVNPDSRNNDPDKVMLPVTIEKITTCFLEADVNAENILNRQEILDGKLGINPGIAALWEDEKQRRRNKNENSQLGQFLELKNMECPPTKTHVIFQKSLAEKLAASSTDSNIPRNNLNNSVYPAETPNDMDIQNASLIDIHTPSSYELSLDDTVNMSCRENLDNTLSQSNLNVTMDDDANNFLQLLEELVDEQINEKEEDSILSQVLKDDEQTEDVGEDFLDLSMPLDAVTTPRKTFSKIDFDKSDEDDDDDNDVNHFDITIIPQFDGQLDSIDKHKIKTDGIMTRSKYRKYLERLKKEEALTNDRNTKISKSPVANRPGKSMSLLDNIDSCEHDVSTNTLDKFSLIPYVKLIHIDISVKTVSLDSPKSFKSIPAQKKRNRYSRKTPEEKSERNLSLIRHRINRINMKSKIRAISDLIFKHDIMITAGLKKVSGPKFNIIPGRKWFLEQPKNDYLTTSILSRITTQTDHYTDPSLHLLLKPPLKCNFLYYYGGRTIPNITEIPSDISESECQKCITTFVKPRCSLNREKFELKRKNLRVLQNTLLNIKIKPNTFQKQKRNTEIHISRDGLLEKDHSNMLDRFNFNINESTNSHEVTSTNMLFVKQSTISSFEKMLRSTIEKSYLTLQNHVRNMNNPDLYELPKNDKDMTREYIPISSLTDVDNSSKILEYNCSSSPKKLTEQHETTNNTTDIYQDDISRRNYRKTFELKKIYFPTQNCPNQHSTDYSPAQSKKCVIQTAESLFSGTLYSIPQTNYKMEDYKFDTNFSVVSKVLNHIYTDTNNNHDYENMNRKNEGYSWISKLSKAFYNLTINDCNNERDLDIRSADSDYISLSTNESEITNEENCSLKSHKINIISNITLKKPIQTQLNQSSNCYGDLLFGNLGSSFVNGAVAGDSQKLDRFHLESLQKTVKRKCMFINCDGTADSISDDELKTTRKPKRRKVGSSHYASLPISITKSPIVQKVPLDTGLSEKSIGISENNNPSNTIDKINQNTVHSKSDVSFKRKLNFDKETSLNTTQLEEFLTCSYSRKLRTEIKESASPTEKNVSNSVNAGHFDKMTEKSQCSVTIIPQNIDTTNSDSDIFSEDEDVKKSFFKSHSSVAEKYDQHFKYHAKEGCSTILTQDNILDVKNSNPTDLSGRTASDTGSDLTPYQKLRPDVENNCNQLFSRADANSQSKENLTPYQELNSLQMKATITDEFKTITPLVKAPSRLLIEESLNDHKIPQNYFIQPFYSDANDYTGAVEIGHDTLRIPSKSSCHYPEFESVSCALNDCRKYFTENISSLIWNPNNLKNLKFSHCSNRNITIRPIKKPPSVKEVLQWLESNSESMGDPSSTAVNNIKSKICIPTSPGHDEEELELSLSITPCTPESTKAQFESSKPTTPSPINSQDSSPVLEHRKKRCKKKDKRLVLRDSLFLSSETNRSGEITGNTLNNTFGFNKSVQNLQAARVVMEHQFLTTMVMELHTRTRGDFKPDPEYDPICAIFYSVFNDEPENVARKTRVKGAVVLNTLPSNNTKSDRHFLNGLGINCDIIYAETEEAVITNFLSVIKLWDPDIFAGYEIQMLSWGYLVERSFVLSINIIPLLSRSSINKFGQNKQRSSVHQIETEITGRIVLDVWRVMRHEIALQSYTFESIVYHILHRRLPMFPFKNLTSWWDHTNPYRHRVVKYYLIRVDTVIELFKKLDFLNRTSELARLFGIQFYEVLSRGSQFRVESMMLRLAKPLNYVPVSPSTQQRARMRAPEYIALVMEPESKLYNDPIIVLDFQSLYPSIIIAYNYCFTTCVGRVNCLGTNYPFEFGATQLKVSRRVVEKLSKRNLLNFSPCGVGFVKQKVRQGILPRMLTEILDTRLMVKNSMKENKGDDNLQKVLHNRQLGLKLIANVTFGYTSANFSGRMCCVDVGDSIISKARETLQRAIAMVETKAEWGARVVYGDTDSLFVMVTGKSREEAFEVGKKIADAVTADNPDPIKLKLEKVYHPCILQTKKRYVGYMYESAEQKEPVYDAKGIETVRRDGCLAVSKMLQKCLTILFETKDVSLIKKYVLRQFNKIQMGRASIQDLTFAKEYRGAGGYKPGACVPALELARKWKAVDRRGEPRSGERVPYIIVNGPPGLPLIRLVKSPRDLLFDNSLRPNSLYYITKVIIPPINRCLLLIGADVNIWFNQMPRKNTQYLPNSSPVVKSTISQYFISKICASCSLPTQDGLCDRCCRKVNVTALTLSEKLKKWEENYYNTNLICNTCTGHLNEVSCISLDCSVLYRRTQTYNDLQQSSYVRDILNRTDIFLENDIFQD